MGRQPLLLFVWGLVFLPVAVSLAGTQAAVTIGERTLKAKLSELTGATPIDFAGTFLNIANRQTEANKKLARDYLAAQYRALGFDVSFEPYRYRGHMGTNVVAQKIGKNAAQYFIVSSHYDTMNTAGADDDGSGTIAALAIAEVFAKQDLETSLRIVAFDQEELGLVGSKAYVAQLQDEGDLAGLQGVFNLEMLGYNSRKDGAFHAIDCLRDASRPENTSGKLSRALMTVVTSGKLPFKRVDACTDRSDHASFWNVGKPAIVISQNFFGHDDNPCYHQRCDTVDKINFTYMAGLSTAVARTVSGLIER